MSSAIAQPSSRTGGMDCAPYAKGLYIDGSWVPGSGIRVVDPSTGELIAEVADASIEDGRAAVDAAATAAAGWRATSPRQRAQVLMKCFELIMQRHDELAYLIALENGKSLTDARGEVAYAAEFFRWYAEEAVRIPGEFMTAPAGGNRIIVDYEPIGVAVLITPWNFPAAMATRKIAPALAAGCTMVLKPASETPLTAYALASIYEEAGVPHGVVNVITTSDPGPVTAAMLSDPRVRKLSFTGSTGVGRLLLGEASKSVLSCSMELGGNAPFIVFDDADLDAALEGAMLAKMRNGGEACTAANRFLVQDGIHDRFVEGLAARMKALKVGPGTEPDTGCGPMITRKAVDKIEALVADALERGAQVVLGGARLDRPGYYFPPTVLADVSPDAAMAKDEIFGPVAPVYRFKTEDEAVAMANDTEYGLAAYIYTRDIRRGMAISSRIEAGMIGLNRGLVSDPAGPFGGVKQSGLGREGSHHGMIEFMEAKYIATSL